MTKMLVVGDTHGDVPFLANACKYAVRHGADRIVQVGDWGYLWPGSKVDRLASITNVLAQFDLQMFFLDGNHEWFDRLEELGATAEAPEMVPLSDRVTYLSRGLTWEWDGVKFMSLGGAYSIDRDVRTPWTSWWPRETIRYADVERAIDAGHVDVMFTHDAPEGVQALRRFLEKTTEYMRSCYGASWDYKLDPGSRENRKMLREAVDVVRPSMLFHGHYHHGYKDLLDGGSYVTSVIGLDCNGTGSNAWHIFDTAEWVRCPV